MVCLPNHSSFLLLPHFLYSVSQQVSGDRDRHQQLPIFIPSFWMVNIEAWNNLFLPLNISFHPRHSRFVMARTSSTTLVDHKYWIVAIHFLSHSPTHLLNISTPSNVWAERNVCLPVIFFHSQITYILPVKLKVSTGTEKIVWEKKPGIEGHEKLFVTWNCSNYHLFLYPSSSGRHEVWEWTWNRKDEDEHKK